MPWPKGKPRKGHIKPDGTPHASWGSKVRSVSTSGTAKTQKADKPARVIKMRKVSADLMDAPSVKQPTIHGATVNAAGRPSTAITEPCPNCLYAYADGGYCPSCGWTLPIKVMPYGSS